MLDLCRHKAPVSPALSPPRLLLEAGADIACVDNEGQLPIDKAEEEDMRQLLCSWMKKKGKPKDHF